MTKWKLVPVEPTEEMLKAGRKMFFDTEEEPIFGAVYKAMLAAAPTNLAEPFAYYDHFNNVIYHGRTAAEQARKADHGGNTITPLFTAAPPADLTELRALVGKWRNLRKQKVYEGDCLESMQLGREECACELDALIERMGEG